ncbi:HU family DNA-binding protein [Facilibium subflavum]|uniref:HU family DNA-binding protein n=1 Tax=Facilibium subflavum TaxID=2219058 RepID=UPI0013C32047|nr:HU family DNA-binding protein [Facilibium subflavum]
MKTLTKKDLVNAVSQGMAMDTAGANHCVEQFFATLTALLSTGHHIRLKNFGKFEIQQKSPRLGRNPKTKETVQIPALTRVAFKPSDALKKRLNQP